MTTNSKNLDLDLNSHYGGVERIGLAAGTATQLSVSQECRSCIVKPFPGTTVFVGINLSTVSSTTGFELDATATPMPVHDIQDLYFFSAAAASVEVLWRG